MLSSAAPRKINMGTKRENKMSLWDKNSKKPVNYPRQYKRNIVATDIGFVRRVTKGSRVIDELLVPIPGLANSSNFGSPNIDDVWHSSVSAATNSVVNTWISFDEPVTSLTKLKINVANTAGGAAMTATAANTVYGTNKILFQWTPTVAGTYKIQAQTVANGSSLAVNVKSRNAGTENASLVISGPVSNTGAIITITA
jgi:hypothetical protein